MPMMYSEMQDNFYRERAAEDRQKELEIQEEALEVQREVIMSNKNLTYVYAGFGMVIIALLLVLLVKKRSS